MKIFIYLLIILVIAIIGIIIFQGTRKKLSTKQNALGLSDNYKLAPIDISSNNLGIQLEILPPTLQIDETKLVEIKDSRIIARINNLTHEMFKAGTAVGNAIQGNSQVLYQAIIPAGAELAQSQNMKGAFRGIYHGVKGIKGHANFVASNNAANIAKNVAAASMGIGSLIVGQYYMTQINAELKIISDGISCISNFQDNEYKGKVFALTAQIKKIASYQAEILENDELRMFEIVNLNNWEQKCIELLGQANLTIDEFSKKKDIDFAEYEKRLQEAHNWYMYQKILLEILYRTADLKHTLHLGSSTRQQCGALLPMYLNQVNDVVSRLKAWHQFQISKFGIDINANLRKRMGFDGFIYKLPSLINEELGLRPVSERTSDIIGTQTKAYEIPDNAENIDLFHEDIKIIGKEGKLYYLPESNTSE